MMQATESINTSWTIKLIFLYWFIRIFKPEWILSNLIPSLGFLKAIPSLLIITFFVHLLFCSRKLQYDKPLLFFFLATFISTFFSANRGISADVLRAVAETLIMYSIMLMFISVDRDIHKLFTTYIFAFAFFGIWGIIEGGRIIAFMPLENEDSFGPFMCIGVPFAYYIRLMQKNTFAKTLFSVLLILCIIGVITSFARGAFLSLLSVVIYIILRSTNKIRLFFKSFLVTLLLSFVLVSICPTFYNHYKNEMNTIWQQGYREQTANDRLYLWAKALDMLVDHPLVGVGPNCYGFRLPRYSDTDECRKWGVRYQTYGRVTHNMFFQILADMGLLGMFSLSIILYYFWKKNLLLRALTKEDQKGNKLHNLQSTIKPDTTSVHYYRSFAIEGGMIAFLANSFFYDLLYFTWFWDLLILNVLVYNHLNKGNARKLKHQHISTPSISILK